MFVLLISPHKQRSFPVCFRLSKLLSTPQRTTVRAFRCSAVCCRWLLITCRVNSNNRTGHFSAEQQRRKASSSGSPVPAAKLLLKECSSKQGRLQDFLSGVARDRPRTRGPGHHSFENMGIYMKPCILIQTVLEHHFIFDFYKMIKYKVCHRWKATYFLVPTLLITNSMKF